MTGETIFNGYISFFMNNFLNKVLSDNDNIKILDFS